MPGTRKLGRQTAHRKMLLRNMVTSLFEHGRISTTEAKAKEIRCMADKMITLGKANTLHTKRQAIAYLTNKDVAFKLFNEIAPKYADREGGYTRVIKAAPRRGDAAPMAIIELV